MLESIRLEEFLKSEKQSTYLNSNENDLEKSFESFESEKSQTLDNTLIEKDDDSDIEVISIDDRPSLDPNYYITSLIAQVLEKVISISKNDNSKKKISMLSNSVFIGIFIPEISLNEYLKRIIFYTNLEISTLIFAIIYIDRIYQKGISITEHNIHKFLFASILIAIKFNEDSNYKNSYYAQVAGVSLKELMKMESEFLLLINYELYIDHMLFEKYKEGLRI